MSGVFFSIYFYLFIHLFHFKEKGTHDEGQRKMERKLLLTALLTKPGNPESCSRCKAGAGNTTEVFHIGGRDPSR